MFPLIISLISSLSVGFFIKYLKINSIKNLFILVLVNYFTAILLSYNLFNISVDQINLDLNQSIIVVVLGFLMPSIFFFLNKSLKTSGLAKTDIFQRMSLIIPVTLSFKLFNEELTSSKIIVILISFVSIILLLYKKSTNNGKFNVFYLLAVFFGYGIVDTLFKIIATNPTINYTTILFLVFICCAFVSLFYVVISKGKVNSKFYFYGLILGLLNFLNIYFYMKAHKNFIDSPTLVFITMNLGVIIGGSLIGKLYFKENLSKTTIYGIFLAISSIILLALIQLKIL